MDEILTTAATVWMPLALAATTGIAAMTMRIRDLRAGRNGRKPFVIAAAATTIAAITAFTSDNYEWAAASLATVLMVATATSAVTGTRRGKPDGGG